MIGPRPRKYLLATDGSVHANRAAEYVARRAAKLGPCEVHLLHVQTVVVTGSQEHQDLALQTATQTAAACALLDAAGVACQVHGELGDPVRCILEYVHARNCDEVVVGSRGMSALGSLVLGSVAYKLVHLSPVPVTVVPNPFGAPALDLEDGDDVHRILLPVDGSESSARAVAHVCAMRDCLIPVEVRLANVQLPINSANVRRFVPQAAIEEYQRAEAETSLYEARKALRAAGQGFRERLLAGHPAQTIVSEALQSGCTRIVMGTRGLGALANVVVGSTALQVMHLSELPVTLVK